MENQTSDNLKHAERQAHRAERLRMAERYRSSGMTRHAFCEGEGISTSTLDWWLRQKTGEPGRRGRPVKFREVELPATDMAQAGSWAMEIRSPHGWTIRSRQSLDMDDIARLVGES